MRSSSAKHVAHKSHSPVMSVEHRHLSGLVVALIILCCIGFLSIYYKIDSDYANSSGDLIRMEQRLNSIQNRLGA